MLPKKQLIVFKGILVFFLLTAAAGFAEEITYDYNHGLGKLSFRSQSPAQSLRLTLPMIIPGDIKPGWETHISLTWTNVWANEAEYLLDYEMSDTLVTVAYGFNTRFGLALGFDNRKYFGGAMDGFIQGFHDLFGAKQDGRDEVPKDRKVVQRYDPQTGQLLSETSASELNNNGIGILLNYNLTHGSKIWPSLNIYGVMRYGLESASIFKDDHPVDYGFGIGLAKRWSSKWYTYVATGYTLYESCETREPTPGVEHLKFEDNSLTGLFALSWHYTPNFSILAQYLYSKAAIKNVNKLDEPSHEVQLGFKWLMDKYGLLEFALIENIITVDNSPDFGLHLGWSYKL